MTGLEWFLQGNTSGLNVPFVRSSQSRQSGLSVPLCPPVLSFCKKSSLSDPSSPSCSLFLSLPLCLRIRPLGNAIVAATPWTRTPRPPQFRSLHPSQTKTPGFHPTNEPPTAPLWTPRRHVAIGLVLSAGTKEGRPWSQEREVGRKGKFLVRVQTHWRLLSCYRHVLADSEGADGVGGGRQERE